jgi:hypothetical protein
MNSRTITAMFKTKDPFQTKGYLDVPHDLLIEFLTELTKACAFWRAQDLYIFDKRQTVLISARRKAALGPGCKRNTG